MRFRRPTEEQTLYAIGDTSKLPPAHRAAYKVDSSAFKRLPAKPACGDWLYSHEEPGQTYKSFARRSFRCSPHGHCDTMYIVPIGDFHPSRSPPIDSLVGYARAHFGCKVKVTPPVPVKAVMDNSCVGDEGQLQLDAETIREYLCRGQKPARDSFCYLAITMQDLYVIKDGEAWNFVFGQASPMDGVGVFSFARYDPSGVFLSADGAADGLPPMSDEERAQLLHRCCRVLAHEGTHVIGLKHCIHFACLMNGSNHLGESDRCPLHLCPVCLRKLAEGCDFDPVRRYEMLAAWYAEHGCEEELSWTHARLAAIEEAVIQEGGGAPRAGEEDEVATLNRTDSERLASEVPPATRRSARAALDACGQDYDAALAMLLGRDIDRVKQSVSTGSARVARISGRSSMGAGMGQATFEKKCGLFRCRGKRGCICPKGSAKS